MINRRGEKAAKAAGVVPLSPSIEEGFSFSSGSHERAGPGFVVDSFRAAARCRPPKPLLSTCSGSDLGAPHWCSSDASVRFLVRVRVRVRVSLGLT